ncbi:antibiotic biosynthesis monooxygenase [Exilibacterium tricleocarpae]|uniref:Antibiotic biosynthesis monooxygenase n=1 Tax=Exilibacterium tricleocarpae TaxID=2591008 RepID=A0A545SS28_9GAMM|nr:antibiotic biosynthesis monooxygenase [Exilibacterium tricleocarpae]TQV67777.1 antibiotic biosynthesis monooxygenase [Exilibacterium tricleocarpae]
MIHVLIERQIADDMLSTYEDTARKTLHLAYQATGFVNGETFADLQHPNRRFVLSKWRSVQDWQRWFHSDTRREMMNQLNPLLMEQEKITLLEN